ncbi:hypothetical protein PR003_g8116 [Phytophthora rubi]|uniref:Uncharacterized protein n=1 Tax=Phytophthora rubi TaxID=129364 RepID=A0A6A3L2F2_9STRA|nr:hypothetical protein PR002_g14858 [Phytophthora rubi]KAE9345114.1 hypothetical protein PR003_g8116 [Phytophthora rubi]
MANGTGPALVRAAPPLLRGVPHTTLFPSKFGRMRPL